MNKYPGWNLDLRLTNYKDSHGHYPMGIHFNYYGVNSALMPVRETAMLLVMDRLTDKPNWHTKVFDDEIAKKWKTEALAWPDEDLWDRLNNCHEDGEDDLRIPTPILDKECVDYCILELRHKAEHFKRTRITPTLDATFSIAKSDELVPDELRSTLRESFAILQADQASNPDWHPNTNKTVQDLVHPSMYPLVYGRSLFLPDEVVGVEDAVDKFAGKGEVIPRRAEWGDEPTDEKRWPPVFWGGRGIDKTFWSTVYQWLPANVTFTADGGVRFTSYINNLHPTKYRGIYSAVEKLIETALPMWDQCLAQSTGYQHYDGAGRHSPRFPVPQDPDDENPDNWDIKSAAEMMEMEAAANLDEELLGQTGLSNDERKSTGQPNYADLEGEEQAELEERWYEARKPIQLRPPAFSTSKVDYAVDPKKTLREMFKDTGLQIIVKMASIELTPENPEFSPGGWHVEGQMNEHIVGTALYYLDSENITESHLDFRTFTTREQEDEFEVGQDAYHWMESIYGARFGCGSGSACLQRYGSVLTPPGRLLAFPNVFQHRVSGFRLADPTKPGHRRFIALWLVDPKMRIISTANVPPQQDSWWAEKAFGASSSEGNNDLSGIPPEIAQLLVERGVGGDQLAEALAAGKAGEPKLPVELLAMVRKELGDGLPMSREEAEEHRLKLMTSRSVFQDAARTRWQHETYSFCEH
ncbi:uncharacterized protein B0H64DRAFT_318307 [Chaetomium fimeti]|uniref:Uncharacterized protein n=1 Tax=Chaetomium fimeti TaxID=1854472 RepID=A0AAE0LV72_9PEZI|nr:hypothetical protein B0H64DRAFT_318307 [Chaetomium fimeti]